MKHRCPRRQQSWNMAKTSKSYILTPPHPQGHVMSVRCEEPIDELTVQVWFLYHHQNLNYCTLFVSRMELRTDKWTDRRTIRLLDTPGGPFRPGALKENIWCAIRWNATKVEFDLYDVMAKSYTKFHVNITKDRRGKLGKLKFCNGQ